MYLRVGEAEEEAADEVADEEEAMAERAEVADAEEAVEVGEGGVDLRRRAVRGRSSYHDERSTPQERLPASTTTRLTRTAHEPKM